MFTYEVPQPATIALFYVCLQYDNLKILKLNPCSCNGFVYRHPYMHTHTHHLSHALFLVCQRKTNLIASLKTGTGDAHVLIGTSWGQTQIIHYFCYQRSFTLQILHLQITGPQLSLILSCCHIWAAMRTDLEPRAPGGQAVTQIMTGTPARAASVSTGWQKGINQTSWKENRG